MWAVMMTYGCYLQNKMYDLTVSEASKEDERVYLKFIDAKTPFRKVVEVLQMDYAGPKCFPGAFNS